MAQSSERLIAYGFTKTGAPIVDGKPIEIKGKTPEEKIQYLKKKRQEFQTSGQLSNWEKSLETHADHQELEIVRRQMMLVDYPQPMTCYRVVKESHHQSIEPLYYFCHSLMIDLGFPIIDKVTDLFTASEHSSFYGVAGQRLGLTQDKITQLLATVGKMIKDLFQLVRELRIIDERLHYYEDSTEHTKDGKTITAKKGAEIALKGMWVDMVDGVVGGQRTGSNLFTMAQQLQFTTLPDLFFSVHPRNRHEVDKIVDEQAAQFNRMVKDALRRKLYQYLAWKEETYLELKNKKTFTIKYLRQHYDVIKMYMNWIKPYLRHAQRLAGETGKLSDPLLIAAFESSMVEIEILARQLPAGNSKTHAVLLMTFEYTTKPSMQYQAEGYQRGPIHVGKANITWRTYAWTTDEINNYIKMRDYEDLTMLTSVDESLRSAMDSLGNDLFDYLKQAEEGKDQKKEETKKEQPKFNLFEPFIEAAKGVGEIISPLIPKRQAKTKKADNKKSAETLARAVAWRHYDVFKKANGFLSW